MTVATLPLEAPAASGPPERDGRPRDGVKVLVAHKDTGRVAHSVFTDIGSELRAGDVLAVNTSATVAASIDGVSTRDGPVRIHLSSPITADMWTVEPRRPKGIGSERWQDFEGGTVSLPGGAEAEFLTPDPRTSRLWVTDLTGICDPLAYMRRHGQPIRYGHVSQAWPLSDYQTVFAREPGSAEMPSAARPFTNELVTSLVTSGVRFAPVVLHSGVASFEENELPDIERFRVSESSARLINDTRRAGGRIIAVGTSSVRALETAADEAGFVHAWKGRTDLIITPERPVRAVDGILTGWHDVGASHLDLIAAVGGQDLVARAYEQARSTGYVWHEFGDSLLVID